MNNKLQPVIAHIDMNSYFATCEQQDNLAWRGKPVGVCEHLGGIIIAASVEAKKWGIKTGTPVWEARKLYPKIILTKTNPNRYRFYTARFLKVFADYTDKIEKYSIDEAFLDLSKACNIRVKINGVWQLADPWQEARDIIKEIKIRMKTEVGDYITCSAGISYSKLVAKIASDLQKPDGLVVVRPEDKNSLYTRLQLTDIPGIGNRMAKQLAKLNIKNLTDLRDCPLTKLVSHFGIQGYHLHSMGQLEGSWKEDFHHSEPLRSIGHMYTIPLEYRKQNMLKPVLYKLSEMVAVRLRSNHLMSSHIYTHAYNGVDLYLGRGGKLDYFTQDGQQIYLEALSLLNQCYGFKNLEKTAYSVGVTAGNLQPFAPQLSLFKNINKRELLLEALDEINTKYSNFTIVRVPAFLARDIIRDSVGFGRMKEFKNTFIGGGSARRH